MMTPRLKISENVIKRLTNVSNRQSACLYGLLYDGTLLVIGFHLVLEKEQKEANKEERGDARNELPTEAHLFFPTEIDLCGYVKFCRDSAMNVQQEMSTFRESLEEVHITDNPLLLHFQIGHPTGTKAFFYKNLKLVETDFEVVDEKDLCLQFVHVRLQTQLPLMCEKSAEGLKTEFRNIRNKISGSISFHFPKANVYLTGNKVENCLCGLTGEPNVGELWDSEYKMSEGCNKSKKKGLKQNEVDVINASLLLKPTKDHNYEVVSKTAPVIHHVKRSFECLKIPLKVDSLSMVNRLTKVQQLHSILIESICRSLELLERCLLEQLKGDDSISVPDILHFLPANCGHFVTTVYPRKKSESSLYPDRELMHTLFDLPKERPLFRRGNTYLFLRNQEGNSPLVNPHEGLYPSGVKSGEVSLVQGFYTYHHYMQDKMNDDGWGCAYRSLQTVISWFRLQGYTDLPNPSHTDIQKCLVALKDKPHSFIGSRQWIGSTEVAFCLESMLGVTSRIIAVNSGEELGSKGSELVMHFKIHGTPVMIGGGVLAHTILGVDYCKESGALKFLILDPHYTGGEDLSVIQSRGWCGWKGVEFWVKTAYYNLCLPQRPSKCI